MTLEMMAAAVEAAVGVPRGGAQAPARLPDHEPAGKRAADFQRAADDDRGRRHGGIRRASAPVSIENYFSATAFGGDAIPPSTLSGHETSMNSYCRS